MKNYGFYFVLGISMLLGILVVVLYIQRSVNYSSSLAAELLIIAISVPFVIQFVWSKWYERSLRGYRLVKYVLARSDFSVNALIFSESVAQNRQPTPDDSRVVAYGLVGIDMPITCEIEIDYFPLYLCSISKVVVDGNSYCGTVEAKCYLLDAPLSIVKVLGSGVPWEQWSYETFATLSHKLEILFGQLASRELSRIHLERCGTQMASMFGQFVSTIPECPMYLYGLSIKLRPIPEHQPIISNYECPIPAPMLFDANIKTTLDELSGPTQGIGGLS